MAVFAPSSPENLKFCSQQLGHYLCKQIYSQKFKVGFERQGTSVNGILVVEDLAPVSAFVKRAFADPKIQTLKHIEK